MKNAKTLSRRNFLISTGGAYLAIPMLPSLLPRSAWAQAVTTPPKRLVAFWTPLGTIPQNWYPTVTPSTLIGPNVRSMNLNTISGNISSILGAEISAHRNKILLFRGLDGQALSSGHNTEEMLAASTAPAGQNVNYVSQHVSIDRILGDSPKVYSKEPKTRVLCLAGQDKMFNVSYMKSGGSIVRAPYIYDMKVAFDTLFGGIGGSGGEVEKIKARRLTLVDRVFESYKRVIASPQLSPSDKLRLDSHVNHIFELEKRIQESSVSAGCVPPSNGLIYPGRRFDQIRSDVADPYLTNLFDIVVAAFRCDLTRIITIVPWSNSANFSPIHPEADDIHRISHYGTHEKAIEPCTVYQREIARKFAQLLTKLNNVIEDPIDSSTLLDHTAVLWRQEFAGMGGEFNHDKIDLPVILAGGTKFLNSGRFIDYRIQGKMRKTYDATFVGTPYNQMMPTLLQAFGLTPAEYEVPGQPGYGVYNPDPENPWEMTDAKKRAPLLSVIKS